MQRHRTKAVKYSVNERTKRRWRRIS